MKRNQIWTGIPAFFGILILILDGKTALEGARSGIDLCLKTVIPSLFPFFVLSILLTGSFAGTSSSIFRPLGRLCRIPQGSESILLSGFLGGYPVGAQCISEAYHAGSLQKETAERMIAFCNNAGPAFLFGMISLMFPHKWMVWSLWGIHILSAVLVSQMIPAKPFDSVRISGSRKITLTDALHSALRVMASVCGWIILFRVIIAFLRRWIFWMFPMHVQVALVGLLELSNGCCELTSVSDLATRFLICSGILAFGGLCVTMQTVSAVNGLSLHYYYIGKIIQTVYSVLISTGIVYRQWIPFLSCLVISVLITRKYQKKSSIQEVIGV